MRHLPRLLLLWSTFLVLVVLTGCGSTIPATNTTTTLTPTRTVSLSSATGTPPSGSRTGSVTLHVDKALYRTGDTIVVTVSNQRSQAISFPDHLTNCSVILLQRQKAQPLTTDQEQAGINPCLLSIATRMHSLASGQQLAVKLVAPKDGWPTGVYLATLSYHTTSTAGSPTTISSPAFAVGPVGTQP